MIKKCVLIACVMAVGSSVYAEPIRTMLTKENRLPRLYQAEGGMSFRYVEREFDDVTSLTPYARYTLFPDFALYAEVPFHSINPDLGSTERGLGDVRVGVEFVPYKDLFGYPWIMPHAEVSFPTGSESKGLGSGDTEYMVGLAVGTVVNRDFHVAADLRYRILDDQDNIPSIAVSLVWELDSKFSLISEIEVAREKDMFDDSHPVTLLGGMHYKATDALHFIVNGGTVQNSDVDVIIHGKVSYSF